MSCLVTGMGWVTAAGLGSGRGPNSFSWGEGELPPITRKHVFPDAHPHFGRLDRYSKLGIAAIALTLRDAGIERTDRISPVGLIASTVFGCLETDINYLQTVRGNGAAGASPHLFAYTLSNTFLGEAAIEFELTGATFLLNETLLSGGAALRIAAETISSGECETVLAGMCDLGAPPLLQPRRSRSGALFFVLSQTADGSRPYGRLEYNGREILFEGEPVADMIALAERLTDRRLVNS